MRALISLHDSTANALQAAAPALLPTLARVLFALIFLVYYWNSAGLKFDGSIFSASAGAFGQIFPKAAEAALYDVSQLNILQRLVIFAGTVAEYVLPALILIGLFTRLAALAMIGFVAVQTLVDVAGHGVPLGGFFDSSIALLDERTLWVFLLFVLVSLGAGPLSADRILSMITGGRQAETAA